MSDSTQRGREPWILLAYGCLAALAAWFLALGMHMEGPWPVRLFVFGPWILAGMAVLVGGLGLARALRAPPFLQRGRLSGFFAVAVTIAVAGYPIPFPAAREEHPSSVVFTLPVRGTWTVVWGGEDSAGNLLARTRADRRWGLDLVVTRDGVTHAGEGTQLEDYFAFGEPVFAPCAGTVVRAFGDIPDRAARTPPRGQTSGNHLVLEVAPGEYLIVANLRCGSLLVDTGDVVEPGQPLGEVGNSAASRFTPEPHLALHLQDSPEDSWAQGIPWRLHEYELEDGRRMSAGQPRGGVRGGRFVGQRIKPWEP